MHGIIAWFTRNGVAANLLMVAILAGGFWSLRNEIIFQQFPDVPDRTITVTVSYRGSTPGEIEQAIVTRIEEVLYDIEGVPYGEIARVLRIPEGTVKSRIHRARRALRDRLRSLVGVEHGSSEP